MSQAPPPLARHMTPEEFRAAGHKVVDWIAGYMERVESLPVLSRATPGEVAAGMPQHPPRRGDAGGVGAFLDDVERIVMPGLTHWQSPGFFAFFPCSGSGPGILGELLSAGLNVNGMLWATSPAATEVETRVLDWMAGMLGLPESFLSTSVNGGGVIQGTASESTLTAMVAARNRVLKAMPGTDPARLVAYASTQAHSSIVKGAMVAGIAAGPEDRVHVRLIETDDAYAMRPDLLEAAMRGDAAAGRIPFFVCASVGTTSSTAVDPVGAIAGAIERAAAGKAWLHVDAAHSGSACICPEFRWMLDGIERADSMCFNPHKWLLTNFDCDCFFTRDRAALIDAMSVTPEYLRNAASDAGAVIDYRDWGIPLGRRFRALKLWMVIRHYGVEGLQAHIREHVRLAALFEEWVRGDSRFEVVAPRTVNLVCFRLTGVGADADKANRRLLDAINATGRAYMTHTSLGGRTVLRMSIGSATTQERHVREAWDLIRRLTADVIGLRA